MSKQEEKNSLLDKRSSRRNFIKNSGLQSVDLLLVVHLVVLLGRINKHQQQKFKLKHS